MIHKINNIYFTQKENELKNYIETKLNEYFNLEIDNVIIEDNELFKDLYNMIDSYYLIPISKNYKKTIIPEDEDNLLRNIFLH
jgi:hypothetical protein